jgi:hypothetical protein
MAVTKIRGNTQILEGSIENAQISATAAIATSKLADGAEFLKRDGSVLATGNLNLDSNRIINLAAPIGDNDAARKIDVDRATLGLDVKNSVRAATTEDITLANEQTIDGVALLDGQRVLVKNQDNAEENGIYVVVDGGAWVRSEDADSDSKVNANLFLFVEEGTLNADTGWVLTTNDPITLGTTELTFTQFSGNGSGSVNGAANVGDAGVGLFKQLSADILEFHKLNNVDGKINIALDVGSDEVRLAIAAGSLVDADISATAAIARSKIAAGSANHVLINDGAGNLSSEARLSLSRFAIGTQDHVLIGQGASDSAFGLITNANIDAAAAIARSKIAAGTAHRLVVNDASGNLIDAAAITADRALISDANGIPTHSAVTATELGYLSGVTSGIQAQLDAKLESADLDDKLEADNFVIREVPTGLVDGTNDEFELADEPIAGTEQVFLNGLLQRPGAGNDYTIAGATITFEDAPLSGDIILVSYIK